MVRATVAPPAITVASSLLAFMRTAPRASAG